MLEGMGHPPEGAGPRRERGGEPTASQDELLQLIV